MIMVTALLPLLAMAVSGPSLGGPTAFISVLVPPMALSLIAAGVLRLRYPILRLRLLVFMGVAVGFLVPCAFYLYIIVTIVNGWWWPTHPVSVWGSYVILAIVGVLVQALVASRLARRRRGNISSA